MLSAERVRNALVGRSRQRSVSCASAGASALPTASNPPQGRTQAIGSAARVACVMLLTSSKRGSARPHPTLSVAPCRRVPHRSSKHGRRRRRLTGSAACAQCAGNRPIERVLGTATPSAMVSALDLGVKGGKRI